MFDIVDNTIPRCFGSNKTSSPVVSFSGEYANDFVTKFSVLSKHVANLTAAGTNVSSYRERRRKEEKVKT